MPTINEMKRQVIEKALSQGMTKIVIFSNIPGVQIPAFLVHDDPAVHLNLSYRFGRSIEIGESGIQTTLSFGGKLFPVVIPWDALRQVSTVTDERHFFLTKEEALELQKTQASEPEVIVDHTAEFKLEGILGGAELTPPRTGHLRLLN